MQTPHILLLCRITTIKTSSINLNYYIRQALPSKIRGKGSSPWQLKQNPK